MVYTFVQFPLAPCPTCDRIQIKGRLRNHISVILIMQRHRFLLVRRLYGIASATQFPNLASGAPPVPQMKTLPENRIRSTICSSFTSWRASLTSSFDLDTILRTILGKLPHIGQARCFFLVCFSPRASYDPVRCLFGCLIEMVGDTQDSCLIKPGPLSCGRAAAKKKDVIALSGANFCRPRWEKGSRGGGGRVGCEARETRLELFPEGLLRD